VRAFCAVSTAYGNDDWDVFRPEGGSGDGSDCCAIRRTSQRPVPRCQGF
jgi:hypothetical protein